MKYLAALSIFFSVIAVTILTTPASQARSNYVAVPGRGIVVANPGYGSGYGSGYGCGNGYCGQGCYGPGYVQPSYYSPVYTNPVTVYPVIVNTTGAFDNIYGPGASPARRLAPYRNTNIYHGW